jgi:hypothetical protein
VLITGWLGVPAGIITLVVEPGTPPHQLEAVCQSLLAVPSQVPVAITVTACVTPSVVAEHGEAVFSILTQYVELLVGDAS